MFKRSYYLIAAFLQVLIFMIISCKDHTQSAAKNMENLDSADKKKIKRVFHKPPGTFQDTLKIHGEAAVFYIPDSLQLEKIKQQTDYPAFSASKHEYQHMMQYAHEVIKRGWPELKITDSQKNRYILFVKNDGSKQCIDLDKFDDMYGLFVFDGKQSPILVDAMNVGTQISFYLKP